MTQHTLYHVTFTIICIILLPFPSFTMHFSLPNPRPLPLPPVSQTHKFTHVFTLTPRRSHRTATSATFAARSPPAPRRGRGRRSGSAVRAIPGDAANRVRRLKALGPERVKQEEEEKRQQVQSGRGWCGFWRSLSGPTAFWSLVCVFVKPGLLCIATSFTQ